MKTVNLLFVLIISAVSFSLADEHGSLGKEELISRLQKGGLIVYFRHATTEKDYADQVSADPNDGSTQRVLSQEGWDESIHIGNAFKFYKIPVGDVFTSQYFRAWQTAYLAFGKYEKKEELNFLPFEDYTDEQVAEMKKRVMPFLTGEVAAGTNRIIVAHDDPFESATGIYPEPQGIGYVLEPVGVDSFKILGAIKPTEW